MHEPLDDLGLLSPTVNTIPPPVLPQHSLSAPLQPRRTRSRQDSQSSASEHQQPEATTGYEASISDDLEHGERETRRSTIRPSPQQRTLPPQYANSPVAQPYRPHSPAGDGPPDRQRIQSLESSSGRRDPYRGSTVPIPSAALSTSPQNTRFPEVTRSSPPLSWDAQGSASTSDVVADRGGGYNNTSDAYGEQHKDKHRRAYQDERDNLRRKDSASRRDAAPRRPKPSSHDSTEAKRSQESWTVVPSDIPASAYKKDRPTTPQDSLSPSSRINNSAFGIGMPRTPLNASSGSGESRGFKSSRNKVPYRWAVGWKGPATPSKPEQKPVQPAPAPVSNPFQQSRLVAKSMTDMRLIYKTQQSQIPPALQPGRPSRPQLPLSSNRPGTGGSTTTSASGHNNNVSAGDAGLPASYHEPSSHMEALSRGYDIQRSTQSPTSHHGSRVNGASAYSPPVNTGMSHLGAISPSNDPYPRPQSAVDDSGTIIHRPGRSVLPPRGSDHPHETGLRSSPLPLLYANGHGSSMGHGHEDHVANGTVPTPASSHSSLPLVDGSVATLDIMSRSGCKQRSPSRSPIDVPSGNRFREDADFRLPSDVQSLRPGSSHTAGPQQQRGIIDEDDQDNSTTLGRNPQAWLAGFIDENMAEDGTTKARPKVPDVSASLPPSALDAMNSSNGSNAQTTLVNDANDGDSDSDHGGGGTIWAIKPRDNLDSGSRTRTLRPPLPPLSIENSPTSRPAPLPNSSMDASRAIPPGFPAPPDYIPQPPPVRMARRTASKPVPDQRTSRFDNDFDGTWAPRPPPEDVYERLEEYFPEHDLDKPVIETPSGGTSPTSDMIPQPQRFKHKKSIRVVAAEHKRRIDRTSRMEASSSSATAVLRKRGTKLWGSRLEEVTTEQARSGLPSSTSSESPGTVAKRKFITGILSCELTGSLNFSHLPVGPR